MAKEDKEALKTAERLAALDPPSKEEPEQAKGEPQEESPSEEEAATAEKPEETPAEPEEESVPEDKKEAGRAFAEKRHQLDEMQKRNEELEERLAALETPSAEVPHFEAPRPTNIGAPDLNQFVDPSTGEVDFVRYDQYKRDETQRIINQRLDEERQDREAQETYPQLNKSGKDFDSEFYSAVIGYIATNLDKKVTVKEAADKVLGLSEKVKKQLMSEGAEKALENVSAKEKAGLEAGGNAGRVQQAESEAELKSLSNQTRKGGAEGAEAIGERLKKLGI